MLSLTNDCPAKRTRWCGPTALGALTGLTYMEALRVLELVRARGGRRNVTVKGVMNTDMKAACALLGFCLHTVPVKEGETFAAFLNRRSGETTFAPMLINITRHYLAVEGEIGLDTYSDGLPVEITKLKGRRARMEYAWRVAQAPGLTSNDLASRRAKALTAAATEVPLHRARQNRHQIIDSADRRVLDTVARRAGLSVTIFEKGNGCRITPPGDRPFTFGKVNIYRGDGWFSDAVTFCEDFDEDDHLDWNWRPRSAA